MITIAEIERRESRRRLWILAICSILVAMIGEIVFALLDQANAYEPRLRTIELIHAGWSALILTWLIARGGTIPQRQSLLAGFLVLVPLLCVLWYAQDVAHAAGFRWDPFIGHRLTLLTTAILFPARPKIVFLVVTAVAAVELVHFGVWRDNRAALARFDEPWLVVVYWLFGAIIVFIRDEALRLEHRSRHAHAALVAIGHLAAASRALRDGANTSLQTIEAVAYIERQRHPDSAANIGKLERSVERLRRVMSLLRYEELVQWAGADVTIEAEHRLAELQEELLYEVRQAQSKPRRTHRELPVRH